MKPIFKEEEEEDEEEKTSNCENCGGIVDLFMAAYKIHFKIAAQWVGKIAEVILLEGQALKDGHT
jgi:hypothetical protein